MRYFLLFLTLFVFTTNLSAQDECYYDYKKEGNTFYSQGEYDKAIKKWRGAKECKPPTNNDLDMLINKAESAKKCKNSREVAEKAYKSKDYDTAITLWKDVITKCGDITNTADLQVRISEANQAKECGKWKEEGQTSFDKKQYEAARSLWTKALNCSNISEIEKTELTALIKKTLSVDTIYQFNQVEDKPKFDPKWFGKTIKGYIEDNIRYPNLDSEEETGGIVDVGYIINKDGSISDAKIIKGINAACDSEAIRLVRNMPKWKKVGEQNNKPVKVFNELGIEFINVNKTYSLDEVDKKPSGKESWITTNLKYPATATQNRTQGTVLLDFLVDKDGSISDIKITQELGSGCSQEALRLVQNMPKWNSGRKKEQKVKVLYTSYPVNFTLPPETVTTPPAHSTTSTFVIKPIQINCIRLDDGGVIRTERNGEIYGQVSMRVEDGGNFNYLPRITAPLSSVTFWKLANAQSMGQGKTYSLERSLSKTVSIPNAALNTARFTLITNGRSNDGKTNGIFESDPRTGNENLVGRPSTISILFSEVKRAGKKTMTHRFATSTDKNVVDFVYEIEYIR